MEVALFVGTILPAVIRRDSNGDQVVAIPAQACPELLTTDEAIRYLRLDLVDTKDGKKTLAYYRKKGLLRGTQVGKAVLYRRLELDEFIKRQTDAVPR